MVEFDAALRAAEIDRAGAILDRRRIENLEKLREPRRIEHEAVGKTDDKFELAHEQRRDIHEGDDFADRHEVADMEPSTYEENRQNRDRGRRAGRHRNDRPPGQNRNLRRQQLPRDVLDFPYLRIDTRETLHQGDVTERIRRPLGKIAMKALDTELLHLGLAQRIGRDRRENDHQPDEEKPEPPVQEHRDRQHHEDRDEGREVIAEEREPQTPERVGALQHHLHQPARMGASVVGERQMQNMLEIFCDDGEPPSVRKPVGV